MSSLMSGSELRVFRKLCPAEDEWCLAIWEHHGAGKGKVSTYNRLGNWMASSDVTDTFIADWYRGARSFVDDVTDVWIDRGL